MRAIVVDSQTKQADTKKCHCSFNDREFHLATFKLNIRSHLFPILDLTILLVDYGIFDQIKFKCSERNGEKEHGAEIGK
jgi:hypothetical protein